MRMSRPLVIPTIILAIAGSAVGCGSEGAPTEAPTNSATDSASEPNASPVPSDWKVASVGLAQLQVPSDWNVTSTAAQAQTMRAPKDSIGLSPGSGKILADPHAGDGDGESAVDTLADLREEALKKTLTNVKRLPNQTINGSVFYHFQGENENTWQDHYGTVLPGGADRVTVAWDFNKADIDRKGAEALIDQIMPTYKVL